MSDNLDLFWAEHWHTGYSSTFGINHTNVGGSITTFCFRVRSCMGQTDERTY